MVEYIKFTVKIIILIWVIIAYSASLKVMHRVHISDLNLSKKDKHVVNIIAFTAPISIPYILIVKSLDEED